VDPEDRKLLEEALSLAKENNKMLHSLRRSMVFSRIIGVFYWALILGSAVGAYFYVQPYVDQVIGVYGGAKSNLDSLNSVIEGFKKQ